MFCFFFKPFGLQNYTFFLKYESFFEKKFVLQDFFCIFAPKMKKNEQFYRYLYAWYAENRRVLPWRETTDPYCIWVSEIILQQTRVQQGIDYYLRFIDRFPTVDDLARATEDEVLRMWQGLGYYSRARNLHKGARYITEERKHLQSPEWFPADYDELRRIPGVGDYTAGAIASFAYNLPYPAPDGNVYRVLARRTRLHPSDARLRGLSRQRLLPGVEAQYRRLAARSKITSGSARPLFLLHHLSQRR